MRAATLPVIDGPCDLAYLGAALARAGRPAPVGELVLSPLTDGRSSARVVRLAAGGRAWVLKVLDRHGAVRNALGPGRSVEVELVGSGVLAELPPPLGCPAIEVAVHAARDEWWLLMDDVSAGIVPRGSYDEGRARQLVAAVAGMHARYWERTAELATLPVTPMRATVEMFAEPILTCARGAAPADEHTRFLLEDFVIGRFLPVFLEVLGSTRADFFVALLEQRERWLAALEAAPATFLHGDLRRANLGFVDGRVWLFDWDLATVGPAAWDLQWYWFLQFWAYPPADGRSPADRAPLREHYLEALAAARGQAVDRPAFERSWELSWLRIIAVLGYCLVDPLTEPGASPEARAACAHRTRAAVDLARELADRL